MKNKVFLLASIAIVFGLSSLKAQLNVGGTTAPTGNTQLQVTTNGSKTGVSVGYTTTPPTDGAIIKGSTGIGTNAPNSSAALQISSTSKGLLIPNVSLISTTDATTIASPATSLLVYNTNTSMTGTGAGVGYFYNSGTPASPLWSSFVANTASTPGATVSYSGPLTSLSATTSVLTLGNFSFRYNPNATSPYGAGFLEVSSSVQAYPFAYSYWGTTGSTGLSSSSITSLAANTWFQVYKFGGVDNTEGSTNIISFYLPSTATIRSFTVRAQVLNNSDIGSANDYLYLTVVQN